MKKGQRNGDGIRDHYDFSGGIRGKYAQQYAEGTNVVVLDPDVAEVFKDRQLVNETLRAVARIIDLQSRKPGRLTKRSSQPRPRGSSGEHAGARRGRGG